MEEEVIIKKNYWKKWIKNLFYSFLILVILTIFIFPPIYSKYVLRPMVEETFSQLTNNRYDLDIGILRWKMFKKSILLKHIAILPDNDSVVNPHIQYISIDTLSMDGILYWDLLRGDAKVKSLNLSKIDININLYTEADTALKINTTVVNRSGFLHSLALENFNLDHLNLEISLNGDSLINVRDAHFNIYQFLADSLNYPAAIDLPNFDKLSLQLSLFQLKNEKTRMAIEDVLLRKNQTDEVAIMEFAQFNLLNLANKNHQSIKNGRLIMDSVHWQKGPRLAFLSGNSLSISLDEMQNSIILAQGDKAEDLIENALKSIEHLNLEFEFNKISFELKKLMHFHPMMNLDIIDIKSSLMEPLMYENHFDFNTYVLESGQANIFIKENNDSLTYRSFIFQEKNSSLSIKDVFYKKKNGLESHWNIGMIGLEGFYPLYFLKSDILKLEKLSIINPTIHIMNSIAGENKKNAFPIYIDIENFEIKDARFNWPEKGVNFVQSDFLAKNIIIPSGFSGDWTSVFSDGKGKIEALEYHSPDGKLDIQADEIQINSELGSLFLANIEISSYDDSLLKSNSIKSKNARLSGLNWKEIIALPQTITLDTLMWESSEIKGNLAIKPKDANADKNGYLRLLCDYLNLPNMDIEFGFIRNNKVSDILVKDLHISSKTISLDLFEDRFLKYETLSLVSKYSSFSHSDDSLLLRIEEWDYNVHDQFFNSKNTHLQYLYHKDSSKVNLMLKLDVDSLFIGGIDPFGTYLDKEFQFGAISIFSPRIDYHRNRQAKTSYKGNTMGFYQSLGHIVEKVKSFGVNKLEVIDLNLAANNKYLERIDQLGIESLDIHIDDFFVDYNELMKMENFLFSKNMKLNLLDYFQSINNGERLIYFKNAKGSTADNRLHLKNFQILSLGDSIKYPANISIQDILLKDLKMKPGPRQPQLYLGALIMDHLDVDIKPNSAQHINKTKFNLEEIDLYKSFSDQLSAIQVEKLELRDFNLKIPLKINSREKDYSFKNIDLVFEDINIDKRNIAFSKNRFFYSLDVRVNVPGFSMISNDRFYNYSFENLILSSKEEHISIDSIRINSRYDRKTFTANHEFQTDQLDMFIPNVLLDGVNYREAIFRNRYKVAKIDLDQAQLHIYKDKTIPPDTSRYKPMPALSIQKLKFYLSIDSIQFKNGFVKYEESSQHIPKNGEITFSDLQGRITGLSNDPDLREFGGALKLIAQAKIMSEAKVALSAIFPLNSQEQDFVVTASMEELKASSLNTLMQPLTLLSAKEGMLYQMQMNVRGNDIEAYGEMLLKYEGLKVEVLKKNMEESPLASFLANSILIKRNNNNFFVPRKGPIYYKRVKYRSFFHYLSHFAILGAKTSLGIDNRKTARKIKQIEKEKQN